jgi:CheY-like chemotaxis protein
MSNTSPSKGTVLFIDDDKFLTDMYAMKFSKEGYAIQACLSAGDALKVLRDGFAPDVIIFDITMPEQDGFAFLEALRSEKLGMEAVKVALTNQNNDEEQKKAVELGADKYLVKASLIPSEVVNIVGTLLHHSSKA